MTDRPAASDQGISWSDAAGLSVTIFMIITGLRRLIRVYPDQTPQAWFCNNHKYCDRQACGVWSGYTLIRRRRPVCHNIYDYYGMLVCIFLSEQYERQIQLLMSSSLIKIFKLNKDFQDYVRGGHLGFPLGTTLAICDLQFAPITSYFVLRWADNLIEEPNISTMP